MITTERHGKNGFGYDPIFFVPELNKTMAEITNDEKGKSVIVEMLFDC